MNNIKIIIVDDHALYRMGERAVITENLPNAEILAELSSGEELLVYLQSGTQPDIILLDIMMEGMNGVDTAKELKRQYPDIKIIMLSSEIEPELVNELLDIGVNAYLSKLSGQKDLTNAIKSVNKGNLFYGKNIAHIIYASYISKENEQPKKGLFSNRKKSNFTPISSREKEIITLFCDGLSTKQISEQLNISKRTVDNHKANIMEKMGFESGVELIKYAIKEGIVSL